VDHTPVMVSEVLANLLHENSKLIVDGTVGAGGHAEAVLDRHPDIRLVGVDRDPTALRIAADRLARFGDRVRLVRGVFSELAAVVGTSERADGVLLDLGLSSMQLGEPDRGFSYAADGRLDMRMGQVGLRADEWIESADVAEITTALRRNGEVRRAKGIARAMKEAADVGRLHSTGELRAVVERVLGAGATPSELSRVFQAIRIRINDELEHLDRFLRTVLGITNAGAHIVIISYHSLEDRAVKSFFKVASALCICPPGAPVCTCGHSPALKLLTRRVVRPTGDEAAANVRSRSARLRAAEVLTSGRDR
jgi:16S rRNA (cytosine1402-N4)-methyltransferase